MKVFTTPRTTPSHLSSTSSNISVRNFLRTCSDTCFKVVAIVGRFISAGFTTQFRFIEKGGSLTFALLSAVMLAISSSAAEAATEANDYYIKVDITGSNIPLKLIHSTIPFNKNYSSFNDVDKSTYRSYYENIPSENTPPFPRAGLGQIAKDVKDAHTKMQKPGSLFVVASVDKAGKIEKVSVFDSPDDRMSQLVSAAIWEETFMPGMCAGSPCAMEFVLDWKLLPVRGNAVVDSNKTSRSSRKRSD